uniref:Putative caspase n=1 Tax=Amblyomma sculptum TaxID=1581419 RepID=A0A1E1XLC0_AMBSC
MKVKSARKRMSGKNVYRMVNSPRGKCVIINNVEFHNPDDWRHGSDVDARRMETLFNALHFDCDVHRDLTAKQMKAVLKEAANPEHHKDADCVVVVLLSHGMRDNIAGVDGVALRLHEDVYELFSNESCPTLMRKPKIFIVQACRGPYEDCGTLGPLDQADAIPVLLSQDKRPITEPRNFLYASGCSDMYIIYAASPGYKAYRNKFTGSFFLRTLFEVFCEHACDENLADLMSRVSHIVKKYCAQSERGLRKQTPSVEHVGWEKKLYFNPGLPDPVIKTLNETFANAPSREQMTGHKRCSSISPEW